MHHCHWEATLRHGLKLLVISWKSQRPNNWLTQPWPTRLISGVPSYCSIAANLFDVTATATVSKNIIKHVTVHLAYSRLFGQVDNDRGEMKLCKKAICQSWHGPSIVTQHTSVLSSGSTAKGNSEKRYQCVHSWTSNMICLSVYLFICLSCLGQLGTFEWQR